jgi:Arm DNA-binding domain/Phage integrase family
MPRIRLTKSAIDALPTPRSDIVYWDAGFPGFGVKVTPKGRKVFIVLYRNGGARSRLRKYTIGPYGRVTLHQARVAAQKIHAARLEGRDPASEKAEAKRRLVVDRVEDVLEAFVAQHVSQNRSAREVSRMLRREIGAVWGSRSIHEITKRDIIDVISAIEQRGAPIAANKMLKSIKTFFRWCVGRALLAQSPAGGIPLPAKEIARDRVLSDDELSRVIKAARKMRGAYGRIVEFLALTGQRREEVAQATWEEFDLKQRLWSIPNHRTKNGKAHVVHLSDEAVALLQEAPKFGHFPFSESGDKLSMANS